MSDIIHQLYQQQCYPPMSHPVADPAVSAVAERVSLGIMMELAVSAGRVPAGLGVGPLYRAIQATAPGCAAVRDIAELLPDCNLKSVASQIFQGITQGWIRPWVEPVEYDSVPTDFPELNSFRLHCVRECLPLVDSWHRACEFPRSHYQVLAAMDGSRHRDERSEERRVGKEC